MPYLSPQIIDNILQNFLLDAVNFAKANDDWHLKSECNSKIVEYIFFDFFVHRASLSIHHYQSVVREVHAKTSHESFCVSLVATHINERYNFWAIFHDLRPTQVTELRQIGDLPIAVESKDVLVHWSRLSIQNLRVVLVHMYSGKAFAIIFKSGDQNSDKRTFAGSLAAKHGDFDTLFHVLENIPINWHFSNKAIILNALSHFFDFDLGVLVASHVKKDR